MNLKYSGTFVFSSSRRAQTVVDLGDSQALRNRLFNKDRLETIIFGTV